LNLAGSATSNLTPDPFPKREGEQAGTCRRQVAGALLPLPSLHSMRFPMRTPVLTLLFLPVLVSAAEPTSLFNGKDLTGWEGDTDKTWRVEEGAIVGGSLDAVVPRNEFLCTTKTYGDFELKLKFKLLGDPAKANAGVQFRTKRIPKHHEVIGYQADIGAGYWGALYDESRRNKILAAPPAETAAKVAKVGDWNEYTIRAQGPRIQLWLNGTKTVDYTEADPKIDRTGVIALQVHGGAKSKVLYKEITIEELPPKE
jgi:hypothetical protein